MAEHNIGKGAYYLNEFQRIMPTNPQFGIDIRTGTLPTERLARTFGLMEPFQIADLGASTVRGIAGIGVTNPDIARENGVVVFPNINFSNLNREALRTVQVAYLESVISQRLAQESEVAEALLTVGEHLVPYFVATSHPSVVKDLQAAWDTAVDTKKNPWPDIGRRADGVVTDLGSKFIALFCSNVSRTGKGSHFSHTTMRRRQEVFKLRKKGAKETAEIINSTVADLSGVTTGNVNYDHRWLNEKELLEVTSLGKRRTKTYKRKDSLDLMREQAERIKEQGLTGSDDEMERLLRHYLQEVPGRVLSRHFKNVFPKIKILRDAGALPDSYHISLVRAYTRYKDRTGYTRLYSDKQIAEMTGIPVETVRLILSVPVNKHALDLPSQNTVYNA